MGCFQVRYNSRVIIYDRKLFIRLATGCNATTINISLILLRCLQTLTFAKMFRMFVSEWLKLIGLLNSSFHLVINRIESYDRLIAFLGITKMG